jgi:hypothetical protein
LINRSSSSQGDRTPGTGNAILEAVHQRAEGVAVGADQVVNLNVETILDRDQHRRIRLQRKLQVTDPGCAVQLGPSQARVAGDQAGDIAIGQEAVSEEGVVHERYSVRLWPNDATQPPPTHRIHPCFEAAAFRLGGPQGSGPIPLRSALAGARNMIVEGIAKRSLSSGCWSAACGGFTKTDGHSCDISP